MDKDLLLSAFRLMTTAKTLAEKYEANKEITSKYVHATSRGHEAIQLALGFSEDYKVLFNSLDNNKDWMIDKVISQIQKS